MKTQVVTVACLAACLVAAQAAAERYVVVNGQRLGAAQIQYLDQVGCTYVPDGRYWIDMRTGIWGYEGGGPEGHISDNCNSRRPSLSERGLLYSPGELLR